MYYSNIFICIIQIRIILVTKVLECNRFFIIYYSFKRSAPNVIKVNTVALNIPTCEFICLQRTTTPLSEKFIFLGHKNCIIDIFSN